VTHAFRTVVADPPWSFDDKLPGPGRGAAKHYPTLSVADICALRLPPIGTDALLFLWRVSSMVEEAARVARAWGFRPVSEIVWVKTKAAGGVRIGMGRYSRLSHEVCMIATRGHGASLIKNHGVPSVFMAPRGKHSAKPEAFFEIVERLAEGPYLELFARRQRDGWTCVGDALGTRLDLPLAPEVSHG
jgi:N6-adenosine-specific RNA methylase IME4